MNYLLIVNSIIMLLINLIFFVIYERSKPKTKELLLMVVICSIAGLGRIIFAEIPGVQPLTSMVIIMASVAGSIPGFICGALSALISNMILGQGLWTLYQMVAWGLIGVIAGLIGKLIKNRQEVTKCVVFGVYGFIAAYIFSFITDFLSVCYLGDNVTLASIIAVYISGFAFAIGHAVFNMIFIFLFYGAISRRLIRAINR